jgi:hypothetical protein
LQAFHWPDLFGFVIVFEGGRSFGESKPRHLGASINVDIRSKGTGVVKRSNPNESDLGPAPIATPKRGFAFVAAIDVVWTGFARNRDCLQGPANNPYGRSFDDRIENKCAAGVPLTIGAMAAVHAHRRRQQFVAHLAARTTAPKLFSNPIPALVHVIQSGFKSKGLTRQTDSSAECRMQNAEWWLWRDKCGMRNGRLLAAENAKITRP